MRRACVSGNSRPVPAISGRRAASRGSRSSMPPFGATTNTPPRTGRRMRMPLYSRYGTMIRGLLRVEDDEALALAVEDAEGALRGAQRGPAQALRGVDDAEVGEPLGGRVERAGGVLLGDLARDEAHAPAGRQPGDRLVVGRLVHRPFHERRLERAAEDEQHEGGDREADEPVRRAHALAEVVERL